MEIENVKDKMGGMKHPFHIHGTQFKVLSVDGEKPPKDMRVKRMLYLWNLDKKLK